MAWACGSTGFGQAFRLPGGSDAVLGPLPSPYGAFLVPPAIYFSFADGGLADGMQFNLILLICAFAPKGVALMRRKK
tara:strand:- start:96 stop:326 length:231 start_codon:yes stop_codon:yes gene_type:complete